MEAFYRDPLAFFVAHKVMLFGSLTLLAVAGLLIDVLRRRDRNVRETFSNMVIFSGNTAVNLYWGQLLQLSTFVFLSQFAFITLPINLFTTIACVIGVDFCYYWRHRWEHEVQILWAEHSVHHSSEEYNFSTSFRLPWITPLFGWIFFAPLVLAGFPARLVMASYIINLIYQYWVHNEAVGKLGVIDRIFVTPSNHRVHHARNEAYIDKNFGGILAVWDILFGTFRRETEKPVYGITKPLGSRNPLLVNLIPFQRIRAKFMEAPSAREKFLVIFGRPTI